MRVAEGHGHDNPPTWTWTLRASPRAGTTLTVPTVPIHCASNAHRAVRWLVSVFHTFKGSLQADASLAIADGKVLPPLVCIYQNNMLLHLDAQMRLYERLHPPKDTGTRATTTQPQPQPQPQPHARFHTTATAPPPPPRGNPSEACLMLGQDSSPPCGDSTPSREAGCRAGASPLTLATYHPSGGVKTPPPILPPIFNDRISKEPYSPP